MRKTTRLYGAGLWAIEDAPESFTAKEIDYPSRTSIKALLNQLVREGRLKRTTRSMGARFGEVFLPTIYHKIGPIIPREEAIEMGRHALRYCKKHGIDPSLLQ